MGFIYLINSGQTNRYKIGISKNPPKRKKGLQTGNPQDLSLVDYYESESYQKIETVLHRSLKHKKYIEDDFKFLGGEWFVLTNEDVLNFKQKCKQIEDSIEYLKENSTFDITKIL